MNKLIKKLQSLTKQQWTDKINVLKVEHNRLIDLNKLNKANKLKNKILKLTNARNYNNYYWTPNLFDTKTNKYVINGGN